MLRFSLFVIMKRKTKMSISRRDFLKAIGGGMVTSGVSSRFQFPSSLRESLILDFEKKQSFLDGYPWPYDQDSMESAERIIFDNGHIAYVNIWPRQGKRLDLKFFMAETQQKLNQVQPISITGVDESFDLCFCCPRIPVLYYKVEYREGSSGWKSHAPREVKTPYVDLDNGGNVKIMLIGDDHIYSDLKHEPADPRWRHEVLNGDYVNTLVHEIRCDPYYMPGINMKHVWRGFTYAHTLKLALDIKPDFIIDVGDTIGPDSYMIWGAEGQWPELQPKMNLAGQSKLLWERKRRALSAISPEIPFYLALGNHDGEHGWSDSDNPLTQPYSKHQRKRLLKQPQLIQPEKPQPFPMIEPNRISGSQTQKNDIVPRYIKNEDENFFPIKWANEKVVFFLLDVNSYLPVKPRKVTDWGLGTQQKKLVEDMLSENQDAPWKFIAFHNTVGGYPLGSGTWKGAYGRGPLFTQGDYEIARGMNKTIDPSADFNPNDVEQVWLTDLALEKNVRGFFYGHDHVFFHKIIDKTVLGKEMIGACVGSTTYTGGNLYENIWCNPYWIEYYGSPYTDPPDFLTTPGVTMIEIDKNGADVKYVCSGPDDIMLFSNMPPGTQPGDVLREYRLSK